MGNGITETTGFNTRLQMTSLTAKLGTATRLGLTFGYDTASSNNGNLLTQRIQYDAAGSETASLDLTQNYAPTGSPYDPLNRLAGFSEGSIAQTYGYDAYGNRWVPSSPGYTLSGLTPVAQSVYNAGNNRINGVGYDNRGNQTLVSPYTLAYDQEDRQISAVSSQNGSASYAYDGNGRRVQKMTCSNTTACTSSSSNLVTTAYVYDAFGQLAAEYGSPTVSNGTEYLTGDHLGSTRLVTDSGGNVLRRYDYLPFGEELFAGVNGRSSKYPAQIADADTLKFTGKERDAESGLDYFGFRYFSGAQGRFTSPDDVLVDQQTEDPQSWNLYGYVRNNPLRYTDADGQACVVDPKSGKEHDDNNGGQTCAQAHGEKTTPSATATAQVVDPTILQRLGLDSAYNRAREQQSNIQFGLPVDTPHLRGEMPIGPPAVAAEEGASVLARLINLLRQALKGKGNFGLGEATAAEAEAAGRAWVGDGAKLASDGKTLVSQDGLRQYRPPSLKPILGKTQANFEARPQPSGQWQSNGHLDIK